MSKILIVDDSPTETHILTNMLKSNGYQVITATNGQEGIEKAKCEQPDLVLMDIVMPGLNGFQSTRTLKKTPETSDIPVIMVSTKSQETDVIWAMRQGAKEFVTKPVNEKDLIRAIKGSL